MGDPMAPSECEGNSEGEGQSRPGDEAASGGPGWKKRAHRPASRAPESFRQQLVDNWHTPLGR
jgi:hypothetical protein